MHFFNAVILLISVLVTLSNSQLYTRYSYPAQRRAGYTYGKPYYQRPKTASYNTVSNPTKSNSYYQQTPPRNYKQTSSYYPSTSSTGSYNPYGQQSSSLSSISTGSRGSYNPYNNRNYVTSSAAFLTNSSPSNVINRNAVSSPTTTGSRGSYTPSNSIYSKAGHTSSSLSSSTGSRGSYNSVSDPITTKQYLTNSYSNGNYNKDTTTSSLSSNKLLQDDGGGGGKYRVSKADSENAKFAGLDNQEREEDGRTLHLKRRKLRRRLGSLASASPCFPYGRDAGNGVTPSPKEQGRFLWDVNVYNVYPQSSLALASPPTSIGCGGGGLGGFGGGLAGVGGLGGLGGGGLLSDPIDQPYYPPGTGLANFLNLFAPGILQNTLAVTARPQLYADPIQQSQNNNNDNVQNDDLQSDPEVDPNYSPQQVAQPVRRPNRIYYDSAGAAPVTPGQLLGGVSTTVNGIIQQLTGNIQPVYG